MNLGSILGKVGQGIGGGIRKGIGRLGEMQGGDDGEASAPMIKLPQLGPGGTGGFAGNEGLPKIGRPMSGDSGLMNRPQPAPQVMPTQMPQIQRPPAPAIEPIRDSVNISATNSGPVGGSDTLGSLMGRMANAPAEVENQQTQMIGQRPIPVVRPPDLLGRRGDTLDDTPMNHARYGYQTEYMDDKGHTPRRWQDIAMNALSGAALGYQKYGWQGAIGGAGAGAAGSAIDPTRARDFRFDQERMPRLEANRADLERGQDRGFEMQKRSADLEGSRARTAATIAGTKDAELFRRQQEANLAKTQADTKAKLTGKPQEFIDYDPETRQFVTAFKYPDGHVEYEGPSGDAELKLKGYENQKQIGDSRNKAGMERVIQQGKDAFKRTQAQQGGANWRTQQTQAGQNKRTADRLGAQYGDTYVPPQGAAPPVGSVPNFFPEINKPAASGKTASQKDIADYAKMKGISPADARKKFEDKGYSIQ